MLQPSCLFFFIILWFSLELSCKASLSTSENNVAPLPTNLKINLYPGIINVTWDCNITKAMEGHTYEIAFSEEKENINISKCFHEHFISDHLAFVIHNGLQVNISSESILKSEIVIPEGKKNTAAENLQCKVYNVSIIDCSWSVGKEAPQDTQYTLAFRETPHKNEKRLYVPCKDYRTDSFGRQVGCILKARNISFNVRIYVQLEGSSRETSIRFYDTILKLRDYVILDPPKNISLNYVSTDLHITWNPPETYSKIGSHCFSYSVNINGNIKDGIEKQSYKTGNLHLNEKVNVTVRAKWKDFCSLNRKWSRWSDPQIKETDSPVHQNQPLHPLLIIGIITFAILIILILLCHRFQVWKKLFPQIPTPASKIFATIEQKELLFQEQNIASLPEEDEECICLQVTEMPQKEQSIQNSYVDKEIHQEDEECICLQVTETPKKEQLHQHTYVNINTRQGYSNI